MTYVPPNPPQYPPPPPPPPRRRGLKIYAIITTILLACSLGVIFLMFFAVVALGAIFGSGGGVESPAARVQAETLVAGGKEKIAVLPVTGAIDSAMYDRVYNFCAFIKADPQIKAVVVEVDSPGGTVNASDEIYHQLSQLKSSRKVVVAMRSMAASGGYYISMAGEKVYAEPTTLTGSIGVIWPAFQVTEMMKKIGVKPEMIKSDDATEYKDAGSPFKEMTDQDRTYIRGLLNAAQDKFASVVAAGRKGKLKEPLKEVAIGKIWNADDALKMGLIDEIAYLDEVYAAVARDAGLSGPTVIRLKNRSGLFDLIGASSSLGNQKIEVHLDPKAVEQLNPSAMEYRYDGIH